MSVEYSRDAPSAAPNVSDLSVAQSLKTRRPFKQGGECRGVCGAALARHLTGFGTGNILPAL